MKWLMIAYWFWPDWQPGLDIKVEGYYESEIACNQSLNALNEGETSRLEEHPYKLFEGPAGRTTMFSSFDYTSLYLRVPNEEGSMQGVENGLICIKSGCNETGCKKPDLLGQEAKSKAKATIVVPRRPE